MNRLVSRLFIGLIRAYQLSVRLIIGPRCRFLPHCSDYAIEALEVHGALQGSWLTAKRIGRCHPWCEGGLDPVPTEKNKLFNHQPTTR